LLEAFRLALELSNVTIDTPLDSIRAARVLITGDDSAVERARENVLGPDAALTVASQRFRDAHPDDVLQAAIAQEFFRAIFRPSAEYRRQESEDAWQRAAARVSITEGVIAKGEVVARQGDRITPEVQRKLLSIRRDEQVRRGDRNTWRTRLGQFMLTLAVFAFFFLYLFVLRRNVFENNRLLVHVAIIFAGIIGLFAFSVRTELVGPYAVPVAVAAVMLTVLFDSRVALFGALTLAIIGGLLQGNDFEFMFATLFASALGIYSVRDIKNRAQFFVSAAIVFVGYVIVVGGAYLAQERTLNLFMTDLVEIAINSFLLIIAYPLLWVFERASGITTDLTLLELSDTNRPVLKELSLRAPGTFNHTLQVANLAEAAADRIGANALLTRVGALYHDIGKMNKAEYFVENQRTGDNPHDELKPRMSALIITSHVKEGVDLGRQYGLPKAVLEFIPMHHGTSLVEFFYRRAVDEASGKDDVREAEFRYPGPRPNSKETGILMLADSVEAASRSLDAPSHRRLEGLIDSLFHARVDDGQLEDTDLTFRELSQIKDTFLAMLIGMYHVRVKYPDQEAMEELEEAAEHPARVEAPVQARDLPRR
jgi:putative nucleotidyltransferase with HDIG domain